MGYHVDQEACSGIVPFHPRAQQVAACADFLGGLAAQRRLLANLSSHPLRLAVDTGTGWICPQAPSTCPGPYCGCINITFGGATESVAEHVVDLADDVVLMDYTRDPAAALERAAPFLALAEGGGGGCRAAVRVGVAVRDPAKPLQPFEAEDEAALAALLASLSPRLARHPCFAGFAVWAAWWAGLPPHPGAAWPRRTGLWYGNHSMILAPDPAAADAWIAWAVARNISEVWVAPHAAPALIEGPSGGSAAGEARFCDFIARAGRSGISLQLYSDPAADGRFWGRCAAA